MAIAAGVQVGLEGQTFDFFSLCFLSSLDYPGKRRADRAHYQTNERTRVSDSVGCKTDKRRERREREREAKGNGQNAIFGLWYVRYRSMLGLQSVALSLWSITDSGRVFQGVSSYLQ